jgi:hypothetical protein
VRARRARWALRGTRGNGGDRFSGSDICIMVREALMEPLRKCRTAKFFRKVRWGPEQPSRVAPALAFGMCARAFPIERAFFPNIASGFAFVCVFRSIL